MPASNCTPTNSTAPDIGAALEIIGQARSCLAAIVGNQAIETPLSDQVIERIAAAVDTLLERATEAFEQPQMAAAVLHE